MVFTSARAVRARDRIHWSSATIRFMLQTNEGSQTIIQKVWKYFSFPCLYPCCTCTKKPHTKL